MSLKDSKTEQNLKDAEQIVQDLDEHDANNPMSLLRMAYGI